LNNYTTKSPSAYAAKRRAKENVKSFIDGLGSGGNDELRISARLPGKGMTSIRFAIAALAITAVPLDAAVAQSMMGSGHSRCELYVQAPQQNPNLGAAIELWVLGYVSGLNMRNYAQVRQDWLEGDSYQDVVGFVRGYCLNRPGYELTPRSWTHFKGLYEKVRNGVQAQGCQELLGW
jgi:hypothetical protein